MAALTSILIGVGLAASAAGTVMNAQAQQKQAKAQQKAENARQRAMNLDAQRRRRQVVREMQQARALALASANQQGAAAPGSSALGGAYGQISGQAGTNILGINQNQELGNQVFAANREAGQAATQGAFGGAIESIGGMILRNQGEIARVGASLFA